MASFEKRTLIFISFQMSAYNQAAARQVIEQNPILNVNKRVSDLEGVINNQAKVIIEIRQKIIELYEKVGRLEKTAEEAASEKSESEKADASDDDLEVKFD